MRKVAAIFVALFALSAVSASDPARAVSAEEAIKGWIAAIPTADWTVTYDRIVYDVSTDRTTLAGLKATSTIKDTTFAVDTIVITGYAPASDGSFTAAGFDAIGGSVAADNAKLTISGFTATGVGSGAILPVAYDQDRPLTSVIEIYRNILSVRIKHAQLATVEFKDETDDTSFSYSGFTIDNWADGKIASIAMGAMSIDFIDEDNGSPVHMQVGGFEARDTDLDAFLRVYDPSRYQNGVGDMTWRPVIGLARYRDMIVESDDFDLTLGEWGIENVRMRQPPRSFIDVLERDLASGKDDLGPEGTRALFDMYSAFALGKLSIRDVTVDADGGFGSLGAFTVSEFSADGLGEIAIDNLDADFIDGFVRIGRLAAGGIVFPGMDKLFAAFEATQRDQDVDFADLAAKLGYVEAADLDFETDDVPEVMLGRFRLDLQDYIGALPTNVALDVAGFDAPIKLFDNDDDTYELLRDLGYDRVQADYGVKLAWHEADETVSVDDFRLLLTDIGNFTGKAVLGGLPRAALDDLDSLPMVLGALNLVSSELTVEDRSLLNRFIAQQAYQKGVDQKAFRQELADSVPDMIGDTGSAVFREKVTAALRTYILRPGTLTVSAKPPQPVPVSGVALFATMFPATIPDILGLEVSAIEGPEPEPFNYLPPPEVTPPTVVAPPQPDVRHVPLKKY